LPGYIRVHKAGIEGAGAVSKDIMQSERTILSKQGTCVMPRGIRTIQHKEKCGREANLLRTKSDKKEEEAGKGRRGEGEKQTQSWFELQELSQLPSAAVPTGQQESKSVKKRRKAEKESRGTRKRRKNIMRSAKKTVQSA